MKLYEAMTGKRMPCGEGECSLNWGYLLARAFINKVKELELTGVELFNLLMFLIVSCPFIFQSITDFEDFDVMGIRVKRIKDEDEEEEVREATMDYVKSKELK